MRRAHMVIWKLGDKLLIQFRIQCISTRITGLIQQVFKDFRARGRYIGYGKVITPHIILLDVIT